MKYLNKNYPTCPLNRKLRAIYHVKQQINNCKGLSDDMKKHMMRHCEQEINKCWRKHDAGVPGYEF